MYKPLKEYVTQSDELKKLIIENPDLPLIAMVNYEVCADDDYRWWFAPSLIFEIGYILDCEQTVNEERIYDDEDEFEEDLENYLADSGEYDNLSDDEFDKAVAEELKKYEPYWKKVIYIRATV